jgi:putative nucleotidyltransferase with HDIG domain
MENGLIVETSQKAGEINAQIQSLKALLHFDRERAVLGDDNAPVLPSFVENPLTWPGQNPKFARVLSAKKILRDLSRPGEFMEAKEAVSLSARPLETPDHLRSDLLYFIALTDLNEETFGHSQLVAGYALLLARELGIENVRSLADVERGALLHDIGKIGIPEFILKKTTPLTFLEWEIIKEHPVVGFEIIKEFSFLATAAQVVLYHHERFDGKGYPCGLSGEAIPLEARIFSIADTIDAITSDRPYRKGRSLEEAFGEVEKCAGTQFDPQLVEVALSIPKADWLEAKRNTLRRLRPPTIH